MLGIALAIVSESEAAIPPLALCAKIPDRYIVEEADAGVALAHRRSTMFAPCLVSFRLYSHP